MMRFILKMMMWSFVALLVLPSIAPVEREMENNVAANADPQFSSNDAVILALGVANDVRSLCDREPALCEIGQRVVVAAIERARDGVEIVGSMVEEHRANKDETDLLTTGSLH